MKETMGLAWRALVSVLVVWVPATGHSQTDDSAVTGSASDQTSPIVDPAIHVEPLPKPEGAPSHPEPPAEAPSESPSDTPSASPAEVPPTQSENQAAPEASAGASQEESSQDKTQAESQPEAEPTPVEAIAPQDAQPSATPTPSPLLFEGDYLATVDRLRRELRLDPNATDARFALGQALFGLGEVDEALDEYRFVLQERPDSIPVRLHLATALMAKRRWKEAQKELTAVLAQDNKVVAAHHNLAAVRYSQGDVRGAIDSYRAALAIAPDSIETHYHLGVVLRLAGRPKDALPEFQAAAEAGHPKAQYFLGAAYSSGAGVDRDLAMAIRWWMAASEHGVPEARDALSRLRKTALKSASSKEPNKTLKAFQAYRADLWYAFPELTPNGTEETVGIALLQAFRIDEAVPTLIREATALDELSERYLAALYEQGLPPLLKPNDARILRYFEMAAGDGAPQARLALARIHALGLGVPPDRAKALAILKGLPPAYAEQFLQDLATHPAGTPPHTVPAPSDSASPPASP